MGAHTLIKKFDASKYSKLVVALFGAIVSGTTVLSGAHIGATEYINLAIAAVAAFQVWYTTETPGNPNGKAVISGVAAALVAVQTVISTHGSMHGTDWAQIVIAGLTAAGVFTFPSTSLLRRALPASFANNTYVVNAGTPAATSYGATIKADAPTQVIDLAATQEEPGK
jgi:hypothetical protein